VVEVSLVGSLETGLRAAIKSDSEHNRGVRARSKVKSCSLDLGGGSSIALGLLSIAVRNGARESTGVDSVSTGVVLDSAGALESSASVHKGGTVDGEWTVTSRGDDRGCGATEGASESLDVG
jgi:hypothetical protein